MDRTLFSPIFVDVIAELFDALRHFKCAWRIVQAALNFNVRRAPISSITRDSSQSLAMKMEQMGWAKFKWLALRVDECFNHLYNRIELPESVQGFLPCQRIRICNDLGL